jgi:Mn2+/Fe2+ NRAMP family transporter
MRLQKPQGGAMVFTDDSVAPPLIVVLLFICNNRRIVGRNTNGWLSNTLGWLTVTLMSLAGGPFIWAVCTGKAS